MFLWHLFLWERLPCPEPVDGQLRFDFGAAKACLGNNPLIIDYFSASLNDSRQIPRTHNNLINNQDVTHLRRISLQAKIYHSLFSLNYQLNL
jgi:hypothetical protein